MGRTENVEIFEHTRKLCQTNTDLIAAIRNVNQAQEVILETDRAGAGEECRACPNL